MPRALANSGSGLSLWAGCGFLKLDFTHALGDSASRIASSAVPRFEKTRFEKIGSALLKHGQRSRRTQATLTLRVEARTGRPTRNRTWEPRLSMVRLGFWYVYRDVKKYSFPVREACPISSNHYPQNCPETVNIFHQFTSRGICQDDVLESFSQLRRLPAMTILF